MNAADLIQQARGLGLQIEPRAGGGLAIRPATKLPSELAAELRRLKTEILDLLAGSSVASAIVPSPMVALRKEWQSVPPKNLELVMLKPIPCPVHCKLIIAYLTRQCGDRQLREWLTRRKTDYFETIGRSSTKCDQPNCCDNVATILSSGKASAK